MKRIPHAGNLNRRDHPGMAENGQAVILSVVISVSINNTKR